MTNNLTKSAVDRQNILNNPEFLQEFQTFLGITGMVYEGEIRFTTAQIADFYDVSPKTIKRYVETSEKELSHNGYCVLKGTKLKEFKTLFGHLVYADIEDDSQRDTNVPLSKKQSDTAQDTNTPLKKELTDKQKLNRLKALAVFNFRAFLNIGMLLTESEKAKSIRSSILDIVIDSLNKKLGGSTKFINQRDEDYLVAILREPQYRKEYVSALSRYLDMGKAKYSIYTDAVYQAIFNENAAEYKQVLKLEDSENPRETMYSEILKLIASFEIGIADEMKSKFQELGRQLTPVELNQLIKKFSEQRFWIPQLEDARIKMATRDYGFRDVVHKRLENYIQSISTNDYQKFLGEQSKTLQERIDENIEIFKRLKER
ncbi:DNA-binding protein [Flavobacterium sp. UBA6135]|uniref:DNA-binding protein n=1 Tax=Flavobacterium sp. UBA6135 TaxID=1946553 RepID=UPI0025BC08F5|nr:DNA-binding protein [Flavobacterium sp. UBA6135]